MPKFKNDEKCVAEETRINVSVSADHTNQRWKQKFRRYITPLHRSWPVTETLSFLVVVLLLRRFYWCWDLVALLPPTGLLLLPCFFKCSCHPVFHCCHLLVTSFYVLLMSCLLVKFSSNQVKSHTFFFDQHILIDFSYWFCFSIFQFAHHSFPFSCITPISSNCWPQSNF